MRTGPKEITEYEDYMNMEKWAAEQNLSLKYLYLGFKKELKTDKEFRFSFIIALFLIILSPLYYYLAMYYLTFHKQIENTISTEFFRIIIYIVVFGFSIIAAGMTFAVLYLGTGIIYNVFHDIIESFIGRIKYLNREGAKEKYKSFDILNERGNHEQRD